jgi:hypothetical protein
LSAFLEEKRESYMDIMQTSDYHGILENRLIKFPLIDMWKVANLVLPAILVEKRSRRIPFQGESYSKKKKGEMV